MDGEWLVRDSDTKNGPEDNGVDSGSHLLSSVLHKCPLRVRDKHALYLLTTFLSSEPPLPVPSSLQGKPHFLQLFSPLQTVYVRSWKDGFCQPARPHPLPLPNMPSLQIWGLGYAYGSPVFRLRELQGESWEIFLLHPRGNFCLGYIAGFSPSVLAQASRSSMIPSRFWVTSVTYGKKPRLLA